MVAQKSDSRSEGTYNNVRAVIARDKGYFAEVVNPKPDDLCLFRIAFSNLIAQLSSPQRTIWVSVVPDGTTVSRQLRKFVESEGGVVAPFGSPGSGYDEIRALAQKNRARFIDLFPHFLALGSRGYFPSDLHWSSDGHLLAAKVISEAIR